MIDLLAMATTTPGRQRALEIALIARLVLDPTLLAGRRRPKVSPAALTLVMAIEFQRPTVFPEQLSLEDHHLTDDVRRLAADVAQVTAAQLAAFGPAWMVFASLGATDLAPPKPRSTKVDRMLEIATETIETPRGTAA